MNAEQPQPSESQSERSNAHKPKGYCPYCGYRMDAGKCTECGVEVTPTSLASTNPQKRQRKELLITIFAVLPILLLLGSGAIPCIFYAGISIKDAIDEYTNRIEFDAQAWQDKVQMSNEVRIRMVDDLLSKHNLKGMSRQEVVNLLGISSIPESYTDWDMVYWLGFERGFMSLDSEWLVLRLDENGIVTEYQIVTD